MADKKPTADNWPVVSGDYIVGDPESPVAVTTLASHNEDIPAAAGAAIAGPCKTENLGIEKVVANIISNPNIRFLILCGAEGKDTLLVKVFKHCMKMVATLRKRKSLVLPVLFLS